MSFRILWLRRLRSVEQFRFALTCAQLPTVSGGHSSCQIAVEG